MFQMKTLVAASILAVLMAGPALAQTMPGMDMHDHTAITGTAKPSAQPITGSGIVKSIDQAKRALLLAHGPIAALGWPPMTMDFAVAKGVNLSSVRAGQSVDFTLIQSGPGLYVVSGIGPAKE